MAWIAAVLFDLLFAIAQPANLPPAYPRVGATKILDNDRVQVWNIAWLKDQPSPLHRHIYDLVGVYYEPGDRMIIAPDGTKRPVSTKAGDIAFQRKGVTHIEEGTSDSPLRAVFVEMKQDAGAGQQVATVGGSAATAPEFGGEGTKQLLDNDRVTVWQLTPNQPASSHRHMHDAVVVWLDGTTPHASYLPRGTVHGEEGVGRASRAYVFELK